MKLTSKTYDQALGSPKVTQGVSRRARRVLSRAKVEAYAAGRKNFGDKLHHVDGRRPGTRSKYGTRRPYGRIVAEMTEAEQLEDQRTAKLSRTKILRRASRV